MSLSWPWHFTFVSPAEQQHCRELLDLRGYYAQLSVLVFLVAFRCYKSSFSRVEYANDSRQAHISWWESAPFRGWSDTRAQYVACLIWLSWLLGLCIWRSGEDYLHLTKALGHVAISQLPFQVLMSPAWYISASRPTSPSVVSILTAIPQSTLTCFHRLFGRVVLAPLLIMHATLYLSFFVQSPHPDFSSLLAKRIRELDVQWGLCGIVIMIFILLLARPLGSTGGLWAMKTASIHMRRQVFYIAHVLLIAAMCLAAYYHVAQAQTYVLQTLGAFALDTACCWVFSRDMKH